MRIILAFALLAATSQDEKAAETRKELAWVTKAAELFERHHGRVPKLEELVKRPDDVAFWPEGGYLSAVPKDGWGREFVIQEWGKNVFWVMSRGEDHEEIRSSFRAQGKALPKPVLEQDATWLNLQVRLERTAVALRTYRDQNQKLPEQLVDRASLLEYKVTSQGARLSIRETPPPQKPLTKEESDALGALMRDLDDDSFDKRETATRKIIDFGPRVRDRIKEVAAKANAEVKGRLEHVLGELAAREAGLRSQTIYVFVWKGSGGGAGNERNASAHLKVFASAEADFRANDRDGNRVNDFWTADVSGLYRMPVGDPSKLIEKSAAEADAEPAADVGPLLVDFPVPKGGYLFRVMRADRSQDPAEAYRQDTDQSGQKWRNISRFGFCAFPAEYGVSGRSTFILNEGNTVFKRDTGGEPVLEWPSDKELSDGWQLLD